MARDVPRMTTDEEAEAFLDQDLSDLDFSRFAPVRFEIEEAQVGFSLPKHLLDTVRRTAAEDGIPPERFMREAIEKAVRDR